MLLPRLVEKMLRKPLQVLQAEVTEPLEVLPTEHAALLLPVFLLVELGGGVWVVELLVRCARDNLILEVVDFFGGGDDLELVDKLQLLLRPCPLSLKSARTYSRQSCRIARSLPSQMLVRNANESDGYNTRSTIWILFSKEGRNISSSRADVLCTWCITATTHGYSLLVLTSNF